MNTDDFITYLGDLDVKLYVEDGKLRCDAPKGILTPSIQEELSQRKMELMAFLEKATEVNLEETSAIQPNTWVGNRPLSFSQHRIWLFEQLNPGTPTYNLSFGYRLLGDLHPRALEQSLQAIIERHEILRTTFFSSDGEPYQVVSSGESFALDIRDLRSRPLTQSLDVSRLTKEVATHPFDLTQAPLFRPYLFTLTAQEHILFVVVHHILFDAWSISIFMEELQAFYQGFSSGGTPQRSHLPIQFADFAHWQRDTLQGRVLERHLQYWKAQLASSPAVVELPFDHPRPLVPSYKGGTESWKISRDLGAALQRLGQDEQATLFMVLLAAWKTLLYRYTHMTDIVVGTPIANRTRHELEGLLGFFVNTLALRTDLSGNPEFIEVLRRVRTISLEAFKHQNMPFEKLIEELHLDRNLSHAPLVQVMFNLQNVPRISQNFPGLTLKRLSTENESVKFDLEMYIKEQEDQSLAIKLVYSRDLFTTVTIRQMLGHFQVLLEGLVQNPKTRISDVPLLTPPERHQQRVAWNATATSYPQDQSLGVLFEEQVALRPEAVAVIDGHAHLTYQQLQQRATQLAHWLRRQGVGAESRVGVCLDRGVDLLVSLLGILKAGGAYVPLDPHAPSERLAFLVQDAGVRLVLTHDIHRPQLGGLPPGIVHVLDQEWAPIAQEADRGVPATGHSLGLAYIMYTSGSTGQPKGTLISHRSVVRLVQATNYIHLGSQARVAHVAHVAFDAITFEVWGALLNGGVVVVFEQEAVLTPARFATRVQEEGVSALFMTTALFNQVVREEPRALASLETVLFGGELVDRAWVARVLEAGPPGQLAHVYGPTESTTFATWHRVEAADLTGVTVPIGRPVSNTQAYVVDRRQHLVPVGVAGELLIGGDGVAWGYLNQPTLTAEKFLPLSYSTEPGARVYRTGDQVRWNRQGALEFQGRRDGQVKVRGHRIEVGEIEVTLREHAAVQDAVVVCREDQPGEKELVAYVVTAKEDDLPTLRAHLKQQLPGYMVPSVVIRLEGMPLTANGKVDKRALPKPREADRLQETTYVAPRTAIERRLAAIWQAVLNRERVGVQDNFFEIGGHSLLATKVVSRVREEFDRDLSLREFFASPTVAGLVDRKVFQTREKAPSQGVALQRVSREDGLPLSFAQQRLWFLHQLEPESAGYNSPLVVRLSGSLHVGALKRSFQTLVDRHETLRTSFPSQDGSPKQVIATDFRLPWREENIAGIPESERETTAQAFVKTEVARAFDLGKGPLIRLFLLHLGQDDHVFVITLHHIISDGWSMGILSHELEESYAAYLKDQAPTLPVLPIQYADFSVWQRTWLQGENLDKQLGYWRQQLAGMPTLALPTDLPRPAVQTFGAARELVPLSPELSQALRILSGQHGVTLTIWMLAAFNALLAKYTGHTDIVVGSPIANRTRTDLEGLIGFFVNSLVLRTDLSGDPSFVALVDRTKRVSVEAYDHQDVPFERIVEELQPERDRGRNPLFQVMFAVQNIPFESLRLSGIQVQPYGGWGITSRMDLECHVWEREGRFVLSFLYNTDLFTPQTVTRLGQHFQRILESVVEDPTRRLSAIQLVDADEHHQQRVTWNATATSYPKDQSLGVLFEEQVVARPEAVAVIDGDAHLTYQQLQQRATRLGHWLRRQGVGAESRVGVCLDRGVDLLVSLLGILKIGGAYVPLDPHAPPERLAFLVQDAGVQVVVTHASYGQQVEGVEGVSIVVLDLAWASIGQEPSTMLSDAAGGSAALAYIMYTSGSTGQPKGTLISHRSVVRLVKATNYIHLGSQARVAHVAHVAFDAITFEVWGALLNGGVVVVFEQEAVLTPARFATRVQEEGVSALFMTTALFNQVVREEPRALASLETVLFGGELVDRAWVARVLEAGPPGQLAHVYGPTESTTFATWHRVEEADLKGVTVPIGRPVSNTQAYVVDRGQHLVPVGVAGELLIGGDGVAWGYLNQPGLTAEKFVPHPFARTPGGRVYRTGDQVRWNRQGALEFQGRRDGQVKVRGHRIEVGEIEVTLREHAAVQDAVVLCREDQPGEKELVAYVVTTEEDDIPILRAHLKQRLPGYMMPSVVIRLEGLPLTANGKVDKRALPKPGEADRLQGTTYVAPRTEIERRMAAIWQEVLKREQVGVQDNFFEIGGHSLLATKVVSRLQQAFPHEVSLQHFFEHPTVAGLAEFMGLTQAQARVGDLPPLKSIDRSGPLPLSFSQQRLWLLDQLESDSTAYSMPFSFRIRGKLRVKELENSLHVLTNRHEALRTRFLIKDGEPYQVITPDFHVTLTVIDRPDVPEVERDQHCRTLGAEEWARPFDLMQGPLIRVTLYRFAPEDHLLFLTMHHIISDGWSTDIFFRELSSVYRTFVDGGVPALSSLPIQYGDYAVWQREWLQGEYAQRLLDYWQNQLGGAPPNQSLPTDHPRPAVQTHRGGQLSRVVSPELVEGIKSLSQGEGVTPFMTLLAAFQLLLARHIGQEDIVVGTPVANRHRVELEGLMGLFLNTLVLRTDVSEDLTVREFLRQVRAVCVGAYTHQHLPFEQLVEALQPVRDLSRTPLFQIFFNLVDLSKTHLDLAGVQLTPLSLGEEARAKFDLTLFIGQRDQTWTAQFIYNTDLFEPSTIAWFADQYVVLLQGMVAQPDAPLSALSVFGKAGRPVLPQVGPVVVRAAPTFHPFPALTDVLSLPYRFEEMVRRYPQHLAIQTKEHTWTYAQLNAQANRLAHTLLATSANRTPSEPIGLFFETGAPMVAALLGIVKIGHPYVPLDPGLPPARLEFLVRDTQLRTILSCATLAPQVASFHHAGCQVLYVDEAGWSAEASNPQVSIAPEALAYLLYTSGTTGTPKGVMQTHRNVLHHIRVYTNTLKIGPDDRLTLLPSYSFDAAVMDIWGALLNGASLHPYNLQDHSPEDFTPWLAACGITIYHSTPTVYRYWLKGQTGRVSLPALRLVVLGGEEATRADFEAYQQALPPGCLLVNGLGSTESSQSFQFIANTDMAWVGPTIPVGYPVEETQVVLLDEAGREAELYGEILVESPYVAVGYWHQPELTNHVFPEPSLPGGGRRYRTGDLGRYRPDGTLEFMGRRDNQVKIRGYRIELGEIESVLQQHPTVQAVVVVCREELAGEPQLVAYVVGKGGLAIEEWRTYLQGRLPIYMVPSAWVLLEQMPLRANGKVNRSALPAPTGTREGLGTPLQAPETRTEKILADIWKEILGVDHVGVQDNFFDLGGHSLLATQVVSRIRDQLQVEIKLVTFFEVQTIRGLAHSLEMLHPSLREPTADSSSAPDKRSKSFLKVARPSSIPLSYSQQRLWFLHQLDPDSSAYNLSRTLLLSGRLHVRALQRSLQDLINRHETLRTSFPIEEGHPVQGIKQESQLSWREEDVQELSDAEQESTVEALVQEEGRRPFNLVTGPLLRALLVQMKEEEHLLLLTMHHIISDGWSFGVLSRELCEFYTAYLTQQPATLPDLPIQYADFSVWQRDRLQGAVLEEQLNYWGRQLADLVPLPLPTDRPRPSVQTFSGASHGQRISQDVTEQLGKISRQVDGTLANVLLSAFMVLLGKYSGQTDIAVGSPIANRTRKEIEGLIGFFVNSLVMRVDLSGDPSFRTLVNRVKTTSLEAYDHQDLPFERLVEALQPDRDPGRNPLFQVMFAVQNAPFEGFTLPGLTVTPFASKIVQTRFDLECYIREIENGLTLLFVYNTDLFDAGTIARMSQHFQRIMEEIGRNPEKRLSEFSLLDERDQRIQLVDWNETVTAYPLETTVPSFFETHMITRPEATAVVYGEAQVTYGELNRRANRLAHYLRRQGVGLEERVGVCLERGLDFIVSLVAILKAGAAYVPIDPSHPEQQIAHLFRDANARIVLTQSSLLDRVRDSVKVPIVLDKSWHRISQESGTSPVVDLSSENLAYVIYTSGSTGRPKGVQLCHRNLMNLVRWHQNVFELQATDRMTHLAGVAFDASVWEIWPALLAGASVVVPDNEDLRLQPDLLQEWFVVYQVTISFLPTALAEQALTLSWPKQSPLRTMLTGGDRLHNYPPPTLPFSLINNYGPTENTVVATSTKLSPFSTQKPNLPTIGRPIHNTQVYILDKAGHPVPIGVKDEIYIGGAGLARGYLNQAKLTSEKFVPHPYSSKGGTRLYKTGDLARYRPNGSIEFMGRRDHQVKVRGYRIELGEIEAALTLHPAVQEAVVLCREDRPREKALVAYVVPDTDQAVALTDATQQQDWQAEHLDTWQTLYEDTYGAGVAQSDPLLNLTGWNSSYTGAANPTEEMQEWVATTVQRIQGLQPQRVLEIGCGTGLLLYRLAPSCERYVGTDFSAVALGALRQDLASRVDLKHVELEQRLADDLQGFSPGSFDTVIINSVTQYFPNMEYLAKVLKGVMSLVQTGGHLFVGDVRSLPLLPAFHASIQLFKAEGSLSIGEFAQQIHQGQEREEELVIDPAFFAEIAEQGGRQIRVEVLWKQGQAHNELTRFRYDVVMQVEPREEAVPIEWHDWMSQGIKVADLPSWLEAQSGAVIGLRNIPNARIQTEIHLLELLGQLSTPDTVAELRQMLGEGNGEGVEPQELWNVVPSAHCWCEVGDSGHDAPGRMSAVWHRQTPGHRPCVLPWQRRSTASEAVWEAYGTNPLKGKMVKTVISKIRSVLETQVPEYMLPSAYVLLDQIPLTANGKVNRRMLPAPDGTRTHLKAPYVAPRTPIEETVAAIWREVLGIEQVGVKDDFFKLGGHSLLATQVVSRIRQQYQVEMRLVIFFEVPTVEQLAQSIETLRWTTNGKTVTTSPGMSDREDGTF